MNAKTPIHANHIDAEFYDKISGNFAEFSDLILLPEIKINASNFKCNGLIFRNCEFPSNVFFDDADVKLGVRFIECSFSKKIGFNNIKSSGIDNGFNEDNNNVVFKDCPEIKDVFFNGCSTERSVKFDGCPAINKIEIHQCNMHGFHLEKSEIGSMDLGYFRSTLGFRIEKSKVTGQGRYFDCRGGGFTFMQSEVSRDQQFWACNVESIVTNDGSFEDELKIKACTSKHGYTFAGTSFQKSVTVTTRDDANEIDAVIEAIYIDNCDFQGGFEILGNEPANNQANLKKLKIKCSALMKGNITINGCNINSMELQGTNVTGNISFRNCRITCAVLNHFTNLGKLYFSDLRPLSPTGSKFSINKTILGATFLLNVDFKTYRAFNIWHSQLTEMTFSDVKWFDPESLNQDQNDAGIVLSDSSIKLVKGVDLQSLATARANKEVFRQLKYAATKQGDSVQALIFQGLEMKIFNKELQQYELDRKTLGNKLMMYLNQSNDYGNNWVKPVIILLLLNILFFITITLAQSGQFCMCPASSFEELKKNIEVLWLNNGAYWSLLNPVRRLSDVYLARSFSGLTIFLDYLDRIVISYFIFQTISAFRKFNK
ncbi:hypothetical protein ACXZ1K_15875 [Pedobacter sp. PWIIR3]